MDTLKRCLIGLILTLSIVTLTADDFFDDFSEGLEGEASNVSINGEINIGINSYISDDVLEEELDVVTEGSITLSYTGTMGDITIKTKLTPDSITLDECFTNIYFDYFNLEAGILKTVWGKGDKLHVVDLLNPTDYSSYFTNDYLENKIAVPTLKVNVPLGISGLLELVYIPVLEGDNIPTSGRWVPGEVTEMKSRLTSLVETGSETVYSETYAAVYEATLLNGGTAVAAGGAASGAAMAATLKFIQDNSDISSYYPDTDSLSYSQAAVRVTTSVKGMDLGALYYYGYDKQPSFNMEKLKFEYEKLQMIGLEFSTALYGFNLRAEGAYYVMDDSDDSLNYLAGFDYNIPLNNLNLNTQIKGNYLLHSDEDNENLLVVKLSDSYNHEKITASVTALYYLENEDIMIKPEFTTTLGDTLTLNISSGIFTGVNNTMLGQYDDNDYISLNLQYMF